MYTATDDPSSLYRHVKIRAWERYRLDLSNDDCRDLCWQFNNKKTLFVGRGHTDRTEIHVAKIKGQHVRAVFTSEGQICTLLPWGAVKEPGKKIKLRGDRRARVRQKKVRLDDD